MFFVVSHADRIEQTENRSFPNLVGRKKKTYNVQLGLYDTLQVIVGSTMHSVAILVQEGSYNLESLFARLKSDLDALNVGTWTFSYNPTTF